MSLAAHKTNERWWTPMSYTHLLYFCALLSAYYHRRIWVRKWAVQCSEPILGTPRVIQKGWYWCNPVAVVGNRAAPELYTVSDAPVLGQNRCCFGVMITSLPLRAMPASSRRAKCSKEEFRIFHDFKERRQTRGTWIKTYCTPTCLYDPRLHDL